MITLIVMSIYAYSYRILQSFMHKFCSSIGFLLQQFSHSSPASVQDRVFVEPRLMKRLLF